MKCLFLLLAVLPLSLSGCTDNPPTTPDEQDDTLLGSATIGSDGGTLEGDGFVLSIPAGALDSSHDLKLYLSSEAGPSDADPLTPVYAIEGFPEVFHLPLRLSLEAEEAPTDSALLLLGADALDPTTGVAEWVYDHYPTVDSLGHLVCLLPAAGEKGQGWLGEGHGVLGAGSAKILILCQDGETAYVASEHFDGLVPREGPLLLFAEVMATLEGAYVELNSLLGHTEEEFESRARYMRKMRAKKKKEEQLKQETT